eukprot:CAMPEP_0179163176 /NCGR_PEP_ID=MMETSP0796-20121207/79990_1 /TAXON_ID=73915 /ORGANISM="Pyrodinium bahamense, Strain pbaha01" /LENGTH=81 /DNA_ID=CAMNT_0020865469 /DNA_START=51 /DNA_END=292 /DNA_ORIENTATION=-
MACESDDLEPWVCAWAERICRALAEAMPLSTPRCCSSAHLNPGGMPLSARSKPDTSREPPRKLRSNDAQCTPPQAGSAGAA